ncbi:hypothetical protein HQ584_00065, partial [Patescibacteria group bacterium]|nr:hypothetical protein [Patescibacteria group bacterium]
VPVLYLNMSKDNKEAYRTLVESDILFESHVATEEPTPLLVVGYQRFLGLEEIREYMSKLKLS